MDKQQNKHLKALIAEYTQQSLIADWSCRTSSDAARINLNKLGDIRDNLVQYIDSLTTTEDHSVTDVFFTHYASPEGSFLPEEIRNVLAQYENERNGA